LESFSNKSAIEPETKAVDKRTARKEIVRIIWGSGYNV